MKQYGGRNCRIRDRSVPEAARSYPQDHEVSPRRIGRLGWAGDEAESKVQPFDWGCVAPFWRVEIRLGG